jgi:hypothetical protein
MLFRTNKGTLIEINKYNYPNDKVFYQKIMNIKKPIISLLKENPFFKDVA